MAKFGHRLALLLVALSISACSLSRATDPPPAATAAIKVTAQSSPTPAAHSAAQAPTGPRVASTQVPTRVAVVTAAPDEGSMMPTQAISGVVVAIGEARQDKRFPRGCSPKEIVRIIAGFVDAFNDGDRERIGRFLDIERLDAYVAGASKGDRWLAEIDTTRIDRTDRKQLLAYFAERHRQNERLRLIRVDIFSNEYLGRYSGIELQEPDGIIVATSLSRHADDLELRAIRSDLTNGESVPLTGGKVVIDCEGQKIVRWIQEDGRYIEGGPGR